MSVARWLETDSLTNQNIATALAIGSYTASADRLIICDVSLDQVAGNGDYGIYLTRQINGAGSAYVMLPKTTCAAASGETAITMQSGTITVRSGDVLTCYVIGQAGDTSTVDTTVRWFEMATLRPDVADRQLTVSATGEANANTVYQADEAIGTPTTERGLIATDVWGSELTEGNSASNYLLAVSGLIDGIVEGGGETPYKLTADSLADVIGAGSDTLASLSALLAAMPDSVWDEVLASSQTARTLLGLLGTLSLGYVSGAVSPTISNTENDGLCIATNGTNTSTYGASTLRDISICGPGYCNQGLVIRFVFAGPLTAVDTAALTLATNGSSNLICDICVEASANAAAPGESEDLSLRTWTTPTAVSKSFVDNLLTIDLADHIGDVIAAEDAISAVNVWLKPTDGDTHNVYMNEGATPPSLAVTGTGQALGSLELLGQAVADVALLRDWIAVTGAVPDRSTLNALRFLRNKWAAASGALTVCEEDDATAAWTASLTTASGGVVTGSDPA